jgi:hypothetical protein
MSMKRALFAILLLALAVPAMAFRTTVRRGDRVAILWTAEGRASRTVANYLERELRDRGMDAYDTRKTFEDLRREGGNADFYIEVIAADAHLPAVGASVGTRDVGVDLAVITSEVLATVRVYDRNIELIDTLELRRDASGVAPTAIGVGRRHFGIWIPLPANRGSRYRAAARAVARDAAEQIASAGQ